MTDPAELEQKIKQKNSGRCGDPGIIKIAETISVPRALALAIEALEVAYSPTHEGNGTVNTSKSVEMGEARKRLRGFLDDIQRQVGGARS